MVNLFNIWFSNAGRLMNTDPAVFIVEKVRDCNQQTAYWHNDGFVPCFDKQVPGNNKYKARNKAN